MMMNKERYIAQTESLVNGLLREAIGYRVMSQIPYYKGIVGYMVEVPLMWIRHSRFPILFVAYERDNGNVLADIVKQLQIASVTEYFAILIVIPRETAGGNEANELRQIVSNSVYYHDFVVLDQNHLRSIISQNNSQRLIEIILSQGVTLSNLSPYITKGPVPTNMFFGREKEIKQIAQTISSRDFSIVGGRRIGKSSTLLRLNSIWRSDDRYFVTYLNCEEQFTVDDFLFVLTEELPVHSGEVSVKGLRRFIDLSQEAHKNQQLVFLFDEVDRLIEHDAKINNGKLVRTFRGLSQEGKCRFVFSGSRTLFHHLHDASSPFFNFSQPIALKPLSERSISEIIRKPLQQFGIEFLDEDQLIKNVIEVTSCHPSLVQWLCNEMLKEIADGHVSSDTILSIASSAPFAEHYLETAWGDAKPIEKLLTALVDTPTFSVEDIYSRVAAYGIDNEEIRDAFRILEMYALIERVGDTYKFVLTQFPYVLRKVEHIPLLLDNLRQQLEG